jgi:hypothetical protein
MRLNRNRARVSSTVDGTGPKSPPRIGRRCRGAQPRMPADRRFRDRKSCDQALSAPDAFATWVAIASISAGERQSYGSRRSSLSRERIAGI